MTSVRALLHGLSLSGSAACHRSGTDSKMALSEIGLVGLAVMGQVRQRRVTRPDRGEARGWPPNSAAEHARPYVHAESVSEHR